MGVLVLPVGLVMSTTSFWNDGGSVAPLESVRLCMNDLSTDDFVRLWICGVSSAGGWALAMVSWLIQEEEKYTQINSTRNGASSILDLVVRWSARYLLAVLGILVATTTIADRPSYRGVRDHNDY